MAANPRQANAIRLSQFPPSHVSSLKSSSSPRKQSFGSWEQLA
ncbi:unnamed protein product [Fusarium graminearum]|nr:unnamed protein product [Fusarium graminearum]